MTRLADAMAALVGLGAPYASAMLDRFRNPTGGGTELWPVPTVRKTRDERAHEAAVKALAAMLEDCHP